MLVEKLLLAVLFIGSGVLETIGNNILIRLVLKYYLEEMDFRLSPSKRILRRIRDEQVQRKLNQGLKLVRLSWLGLGMILFLILCNGLNK